MYIMSCELLEWHEFENIGSFAIPSLIIASIAIFFPLTFWVIFSLKKLKKKNYLGHLQFSPSSPH